MSKTLFEQYQEAKAALETTKPGDLESQQLRDQFIELSAIIEAEGLKLVRSNGQYVICTVEGDAVTDYLANLDDVESWLDDPGFIQENAFESRELRTVSMNQLFGILDDNRQEEAYAFVQSLLEAQEKEKEGTENVNH